MRSTFRRPRVNRNTLENRQARHRFEVADSPVYLDISPETILFSLLILFLLSLSLLSHPSPPSRDGTYIDFFSAADSACLETRINVSRSLIRALPLPEAGRTLCLGVAGGRASSR